MSATEACEPVLAMRICIQPLRKPAPLPYASRMKTYSPPARGIIAASSA